MAIGKHRNRPATFQVSNGFPPWYAWLVAHAFIHGGAIYLITGQWIVGLVETTLHATIDFAKTENRFNFLVDQGLHIACKFAYVLVLI